MKNESSWGRRLSWDRALQQGRRSLCCTSCSRVCFFWQWAPDCWLRNRPVRTLLRWHSIFSDLLRLPCLEGCFTRQSSRSSYFDGRNVSEFADRPIVLLL